MQVVDRCIELLENDEIDAHERILQEYSHVIQHLASWAAQKGNLRFVEFSQKYSFPWNDAHLSAISAGHLNILKWSIRNGYCCNGSVEAACREGRLKILKYLYKEKFVIDEKHLKIAADNGHQDVVDWINQSLVSGNVSHKEIDIIIFCVIIIGILHMFQTP